MTWPNGFQALCLAVLAAAYALYLRQVPRAERKRVLTEMAWVALGAWLAEETSILRYRVYGYPSWWWLRIDQVPILIVAIWPMVVMSSRQVVTALFPAATGARRAAIVGAAVAIDASLVEIVAVWTGLWSWSLEGYLMVPVIGILGWGFYAFGITWALERAGAEGPARRVAWLGGARLAPWASPIVALAITHALLVASWWLCFKWVSRPLPFAMVYLFAVLAIVGAFALLARPKLRIPLAVATPRVLAASVFVILLAAHAIGTETLAPFHWLHLAAVAMLYSTAVRWR